MVTLEGLKTRFPDLTGTDEFLQSILDDAIADVSADIFGVDTDRAIYYLAAHHGVTLSGAVAATNGVIQSVSAGSASITYGSAGGAVSSSGLSATGYGQQYLRLARLYVGATVV